MGINTALSDALPADKWMNRRNGQVAGPQIRPTAGAQTSSYFGYQPELSADDLARLRRQQADAHAGEVEVDRQNTWMLAPVLAPELLGLAAEGALFFAGRAAAKRLSALPEMALNLEKFPRTGNFWEVRVGKRAHKALNVKTEAKPGWEPEPTIRGVDGKIYKPDATLPKRPSNPRGRFIELKPDTPSGHRAGARALKRYEAGTEMHGRVVYYKPRDYR